MITSYEPHRLMVELLKSSRIANPLHPIENGSALTPAAEKTGTELPRGRGTNDTTAEDGLLLPISPAAGRGISLETTLKNRVSVREYSQDPLSQEHVAVVLETAWRLQQEIWSEETDHPHLELQVLALNIRDVAPALYKYEPDYRSLKRISAAIESVEAAEDLVLQKEFALAGALILVVGDLHKSLKLHSLHGHRELLFRAGFTAHGAWMAAMAAGLAGCVFAGLLPDKLQALGGADGYRRLSLFACAVGRPPNGVEP